MTITLTLVLDVPVRPVDARGLNGFWGVFCYIWLDLEIFIEERGDEVK